MKKYISKIKICMLSIIFATFLCFGSAIFLFNDLKTDESKKQNSQLQNTMPESYTGNYIVVNGQVYAETQENEDDSTKLVNIKAKQNDSNATLANNTLQSGLNTFGFSTNGTLNITFIKDEASSSAFADSVLSVATYAYSARNNGDNIASTLSATYNNGTVEMTVSDQNGEVYIETSSDASYTLGELVTGTSQSLNVDNCVFSIDSAVTADDASSNGKTNMLASATLGSSHGRANLTAAGEPAEKNGQVLKMNNGKITLGSKTTKKIYQPKLDGEAYRKGSAILQAGGTLNLTNLEFSNFSATTNGGTICTNTGTLTVTGCEFINCQSLSEAEDTGGGAIYIGGGTATIIGGTIKNCYAAYGAAVYIAGESKLDISGNIKMQNNYATCMGGAIYSSNSTINMTSGEISNNTAGQNGGGVRLESCTGTFSGGVIGVNNSGDAIADLENYSNKANLGGGLSIASASNVEIKGTMISHNIANTAGGIFVESGSTLTLTSGLIKNNAVTERHGGGMTVDGVLNMNGGHVYHNAVKNSNGETEGNGGGIFVGKNGTVNLNGGLIDWNSGSAGAGIHGWEATINIAGTEIACNNSTDEAGAIFLNGGTLNLKQGSIHENSAKGNGGAIYSINATINMTGGEIGDSSRTTGATSTDFSNKSGEHGGAIYIKEGSTLNLHGGAIAHNVSMQAGGAVFSESAIDKINITDPFVAKYNKSAASGGAIYAFGVVTMSGGTLDHNSANGWGGGIIVKTAGNVFSGGTISYNSATVGGGLMIKTSGSNQISGGKINNNTGTSAGGGIRVDGTVTISGTTEIKNNRASEGAGISVATGVTISGGTISGNIATRGGAIHNTSSLTITGGTISGNNAETGGAIYNAGTTRISGGNITANGDATKCIIGGIYSNRTLDVSGGYITNNQSSWRTQNIRIVDGTFTISGNATISTNRANVTNIYIEKGTFNLNSNFTSNNGSNSGAIGLNENIYINVNTTLNKTYTIQKSTLTSFDDGDKASSYIAYSTNNTYLSSAKTYLSVLSLPAGRTTSITRKTNYLVMEHTRHAVDLNPILNGEKKGDGVSGVKFGIKINGVDKGYVNDFYDAQILYGSTWEIYGAQYDNTKYVISSGVPSSGTITGYISIEPEVVSLYTITFKVNNSNYGTIGGPYLGGTNLSTATFRVRHDDYDSIVIRDNIIALHYPELVTATPKTGYRFTSWSGNTSGVIAEDRTITANFSPIFYDLWFEVNHADCGYLNWDTNGQTGSSLEYNGAHGDVFQISGSQLRTGDDELFYAVANTGYKFSHWNINGINYTTGQFTLTGETTITAVFTQLTYTVTITSNNSVMGTVSKTTVTGVPYNTSITTAGSALFVNGKTITATAKTGYKFSNWSMTTNKVTRNMTITAVFVKDSITVTFRVDKYIANSYKIYYSIGGVKYYLYELVNSSGVYSVELPKSFKIGAEGLYYDESSSGETYDTLKAGTSSGSGSLGSVHPSESTDGYFEASMNIRSNENVTIYISVSRTNV